MVSIYILQDPRTGKPFYVGATEGKLLYRLRQHCSDLYISGRAEKLTTMRKNLIRDMIAEGFEPVLIELFQTTAENARRDELSVHSLFVNKHYTMLQNPSKFKWFTR